MRTDIDLQNSPCSFKIKEIMKESIAQHGKVKKMVPKLDAEGKQIYKTVETEVKQGGCSCKNKNAGEMVKVAQQVPEMTEIWEDATANEQKFVFCKIYGQVKGSYCQSCKTYKNV